MNCAPATGRPEPLSSTTNLTFTVSPGAASTSSPFQITEPLGRVVVVPGAVVSDVTGAVVADVTGAVVSDDTGAVVSDVTGAVVSDVTGAVVSDDTGAVVSDVTGAVVSDVTGAVVSDDTGAVVSDGVLIGAVVTLTTLIYPLTGITFLVISLPFVSNTLRPPRLIG